MKVLNPNNTLHRITLIPRFYEIGLITVMELFNEESRLTITPAIVVEQVDNYVHIDFEQEFINNSNFQIKILTDGELFYRGKLFVTNQQPDLQEYKITKDVFTI